MQLTINIDESIYRHFVNNRYSRADIIAIHAAIVNGTSLPEDDDYFARWVAKEIFDDNWKYNKDAFAELACRKLAMLGIVQQKGDEWELVKLQENQDGNNIFEKAIQELRDNGLFVSIWIPVSEGLPEENKTVMASTEYGVFPEARYTEEDGWEWAYEAGADYWQELNDVEAWMPLPEPYKLQERSDENDI